MPADGGARRPLQNRDFRTLADSNEPLISDYGSEGWGFESLRARSAATDRSAAQSRLIPRCTYSVRNAFGCSVARSAAWIPASEIVNSVLAATTDRVICVLPLVL